MSDDFTKRVATTLPCGHAVDIAGAFVAHFERRMREGFDGAAPAFPFLEQDAADRATHRKPHLQEVPCNPSKQSGS